MKKIIGGSFAIIIGLPYFSANFPAFLTLLAGIIPLLLITGGCLTIYLKREDMPPQDQEIKNDWSSTGIIDAVPMVTEPKDVNAQEKEFIKPEVEEAAPVEPKPLETKLTDAVTAEPEDKTLKKQGDDSPKLVGNTGSSVFHNFDCNFSRSKNCTAVFNTREEGLKKGYKPCGICKP